MRKADLFGYTVYENGDIIGLKGKKLSKKNPQITVYWGKNKIIKTINYARFVYYAFNKRTFEVHDKSMVIGFKDGNKKNFNLKNLFIQKRSNILWGENNKKSKLTDEQIKEIKKIYARQGISIDKNYPWKKVSYRKLAEKYGVSHTLIKNIVKGTTRNENNYIL